MNRSDEKGAPRALWPRLILVLWLAWMLALIYMSRAEWGRPRALPGQENEPVPAARPGFETKE